MSKRNQFTLISRIWMNDSFINILCEFVVFIFDSIKVFSFRVRSAARILWNQPIMYSSKTWNNHEYEAKSTEHRKPMMLIMNWSAFLSCGKWWTQNWKTGLDKPTFLIEWFMFFGTGSNPVTRMMRGKVIIDMAS